MDETMDDGRPPRDHEPYTYGDWLLCILIAGFPSRSGHRTISVDCTSPASEFRKCFIVFAFASSCLTSHSTVLYFSPLAAEAVVDNKMTFGSPS